MLLKRSEITFLRVDLRPPPPGDFSFSPLVINKYALVIVYDE
jgi:hypothetical protein